MYSYFSASSFVATSLDCTFLIRSFTSCSQLQEVVCCRPTGTCGSDAFYRSSSSKKLLSLSSTSNVDVILVSYPDPSFHSSGWITSPLCESGSGEMPNKSRSECARFHAPNQNAVLRDVTNEFKIAFKLRKAILARSLVQNGYCR